MPSINSNALATILLTGASGFLGLQLVKSLLERGYKVRGTVRNEEKGRYLKELFRNDSDKLDFVIVPDIQVPGAFDEAVKGVDAVIHSASPVGSDPDAFIDAAVEGTIGILKSAKAYEPNIKRIVITSSNVAVDYPVTGGRIFNESDWNDGVVKIVREQGTSASAAEKYSASKTLAEHAAWDFMKENKNVVGFDITTVCPPFIFGPILHKLDTQKDINVSNSIMFGALTSEKKGAELTDQVGSWIDVRDIARIHVDLLSIPEASNERYIAAAGEWAYQDVYDALQEEPIISGAPIGTPGATRSKEHDKVLDPSKLDLLLGVPHEATYRPFSETVRDTISQLRGKGLF